jgi:hypothetical protein
VSAASRSTSSTGRSSTSPASLHCVG